MGRHPHSKIGSLVDDLKKVHEVLEQLEIMDLALREFNSLSAGQHQKVMLARGLVQEPEVLLLDEPTSNLDVRHQMEVTKILKDLCDQKGIMVIMICHDLNIAAKYADELMLMYDKKVYAKGTPSEVLTPENLRTVYGVESTVVDHNGRPCVILDDFLKQS
jgi:iron complex transport system ATP-binding protein